MEQQMHCLGVKSIVAVISLSTNYKNNALRFDVGRSIMLKLLV
jgi:hypothetical protein